MALKLRYPNNYFLLRGNHECLSQNEDGGFVDECYRYYTPSIYSLFLDFFNSLPIAAVVSNKIFCCHGGLSPHLTSLSAIKNIRRPCEIPESGLMYDLLWSDPASSNCHGWMPSQRVLSLAYGEDVVDEFFSRMDFDLIVRAHEFCDGYKFSFNRKVVTVFSSRDYCNINNNAAGVMCVDESLRCSFILLRNRDVIQSIIRE